MPSNGTSPYIRASISLKELPLEVISVRANVDMGNGHRITSDFPDLHISSEGDQWGPKTLTAEGKLNGGGPVLKVRTSTGDICFKRLNR